MQCRTCGTEIADKALVCYRCGTATTAPAPMPPGARPRRLVVPVIAAFAIVVIGALYMAMAARGNTPPLVNWAMLGLAAVVVAWRFWASRR
ncbi:MAG: hypothetical protein IMZ44_19565 [Planctomycetes bacterium]|nr:hypothetical protein [Planctomycetota bacterium]